MNENAKKVIVTGGAGFIGRCMVEILRERAFHPVILDDLSTGSRESIRGLDFEKVDLSDAEATREVFSRLSDCSGVFHFAAHALVGESCAHPERYLRNNILSTLNVAESCAEFGIRDIVYSSSCAVYGFPQTPKLQEDHPKEPISPYGESKWMGERVLLQFARFRSLRATCLRYFNPAGSVSMGRVGEDHEPESHLIPLVVKAALEGTEISIFGNDYETPDGTCVRDFIHIEDLIDAHLVFFDLLRTGKLGRFSAYNLGTGKGTSVLEVLKAAEKTLGRQVKYKVVARREGDPDRLTAEVTAAEQISGWKARKNVVDMIHDHALFLKNRSV